LNGYNVPEGNSYVGGRRTGYLRDEQLHPRQTVGNSWIMLRKWFRKKAIDR